MFIDNNKGARTMNLRTSTALGLTLAALVIAPLGQARAASPDEVTLCKAHYVVKHGVGWSRWRIQHYIGTTGHLDGAYAAPDGTRHVWKVYPTVIDDEDLTVEYVGPPRSDGHIKRGPLHAAQVVLS